MWIGYLIPLIFIGIYYYQNKIFKQTSYYKMTNHSFQETRHDLGRYGEYLTYKSLQAYENKGGKFLFNCYLPKDDGTTTEIDVMLINEDGIFCFESKNYSGWIFGDEKSRNWTQTLPKGKGRAHKEHFMNPIIQNEVHIKWLKKQIDTNIPVHSIIVFSQRCTLKKVTIQSPDIYVIKRPMVLATVQAIAKCQSDKLTNETINKIYDSLYPYTQVTSETKLQHIDHIKSKKQSKETVATSKLEVIEKTAAVDVVAEKQSEQSEVVDQNICPRCGGKLILRTSKRGKNVGEQFYGCSSYPKCNFIKAV